MVQSHIVVGVDVVFEFCLKAVSLLNDSIFCLNEIKNEPLQLGGVCLQTGLHKSLNMEHKFNHLLSFPRAYQRMPPILDQLWLRED
jgi:hypothetical protein